MEMIEEVVLKTSDNVRIIGDHYKTKKGKPGIVLLHMLPSSKESYVELAVKLQEVGIGALAIDLRGHGDSDGGPAGFLKFKEKDHQKSIKDVEAAVEFQRNEGHKPLFLAGASIGANLVLDFLSKKEGSRDVKKCLLISPGVNYKGIEGVKLAGRIGKNKDIFIIAARDDFGRDEEAKKIFDALKCKKKIIIFDSGGHGTDIFNLHEDVLDEVMDWLRGKSK